MKKKYATQLNHVGHAVFLFYFRQSLLYGFHVRLHKAIYTDIHMKAACLFISTACACIIRTQTQSGRVGTVALLIEIYYNIIIRTAAPHLCMSTAQIYAHNTLPKKLLDSM